MPIGQANLAEERPNGIAGLGMNGNRPHDCECIKTGTCRETALMRLGQMRLRTVVGAAGRDLENYYATHASPTGLGWVFAEAARGRAAQTRASAPPAAFNDLVQATTIFQVTTMFRRPPYRVYMRLSGVGASEAAFGAPKLACGKTGDGRSGSDRERETKTASSCRENPDSKTDGYLLPRI